ncbi:MAG: ATP-binding cassette domain-containing protein [Bacteriovoracaceae bacterium]|nr:ATP-binding cassette domain-containing protein [Bacteriovoracaceae bacterium]
MADAITFTHVVKKYGDATVLNDLTFGIPQGKITTILGFSGAGKSTLMKHILGLTRPTSGKIVSLGKDMSELDELGLREFRRNFGMVFQYAALFDFLSAFENVAFPLREFTKLKESEIKKKVESLMQAVELVPESWHRLPSELSGGMRKRVGLARALALEPRIMLYDEPTSGLDPISTQVVSDLIASTAAKNQDRKLTSLVISHDVRASLRISDHIMFLERGQIVEYSTVEGFKNSQNPIIRRFLEL